jgi:Glyoxalase/Bleomycin resistance protein/Dioxygenase superfamily
MNPIPAPAGTAGALIAGLGIIQVAYVVDNIDRAIERWHQMWGTGPFIVRRHIVMDKVWYRGTPTTLDISAAFVQAGQLQIEFVEQHDDAPSAFHDMYPRGQQGVHHVAVMPEDYRATVDRFVALGYPVATELQTRSGRGASFLDTRAILGHMVEVYPQSDGIRALYRTVAEETARWDGRTMVIELDRAS